MPKQKLLLLFILVVFSSAIFRITNLNLIEFKADEAINIFLASRPLFGHPFPPGGTVSSIGILNPPLFNYFLFPLTSISLDPRFISFVIGLINSFSIGLFFLFVQRYYGAVTALISSFLFASSPWSILFSRKIWPQDLVLPLALLFFFSLYKIILEKNNRYWILFTISALLLVQLHQSAIFFLLIIIVFLVLKKVKIDLRWAILGFIIGIISALPYILYQITNNCPDCQLFFKTSERLGLHRADLFLRPFQIMGQGNFHFILGNDSHTFFQMFPLVNNLRRLFWLEYILLPIGMIISLYKFQKLRFLIYSTIILPLVYFLLRIESLMHYFIILTPLLFIFIAQALSFLINMGRFFKIFALSVFLLLVSISIAFSFSFFTLIRAQGKIDGDYGSSFVKVQEKTYMQLEEYKNDPYFKEMVVANPIPKPFFFGYLPLARMLYKKDETQKNLFTLEERLKEVPEDPRIQNELVAFYTNPPPDRKLLRMLRQKIDQIPGYQVILEAANDAYNRELASKFKSLYMSPFGFSLEYPRHWTLVETTDGVTFKTDQYVMEIKKYQPGDENYKIIRHGETLFGINYYIDGDEKLQEAIKNMDWVLESLE